MHGPACNRANRLSLKKKPSRPVDTSTAQPAPSSNGGGVLGTSALAAELAAAPSAASASTGGSSAAQAGQPPGSCARQAGNAPHAEGGGGSDHNRQGWAGRRFKPPGLLGGGAGGAMIGAPAQRAWAPSKKKDLASFDLLDELPDLAGLPDPAGSAHPSQPAPPALPAPPPRHTPACDTARPAHASPAGASGPAGAARTATEHGAPEAHAAGGGAPPAAGGASAAEQQPRQRLFRPFRAPRPLGPPSRLRSLLVTAELVGQRQHRLRLHPAAWRRAPAALEPVSYKLTGQWRLLQGSPQQQWRRLSWGIQDALGSRARS